MEKRIGNRQRHSLLLHQWYRHENGATVYTVNLSQTHSTEVRGEQLSEQLDTLRALYGHHRFNLIGHSHGGATSRYAASVRPDLVASVTTVGAPHYGSDMADLLETTLPEDTLRRRIIADLTASLASVIALVSGKPNNPQDTVQAMLSLTTQGSAKFNARHPQGMPTVACGNGPEVANGIRYYSMGGTSVYTKCSRSHGSWPCGDRVVIPWQG